MKTNWDTYVGHTPYYVVIEPTLVVVGSGSGQTDVAGTCTYAEFLAGRYQDTILRDFGPDVLAEVVASVKEAQAKGTAR